MFLINIESPVLDNSVIVTLTPYVKGYLDSHGYLTIHKATVWEDRY